MNIKNKIKIILFMSIAFLMILTAKSFATSISVSASKSTVSPGESFTVTIKGTDATGKVYISASNGTVSSSAVWVENDSQTVTVKAGSSGTVKVSASGEVSSSQGVDQTVSGSCSVTISSSSSSTGGSTTNSGGTSTGNSGGSTGSSGGSTTTTSPTLSNLGITPHDFTGFSSSKTSYSVTVPNDCTSVTVYATSNNGTVSGTGTKTLSEGTNKFTITVSNSAGSKQYTLSVIRETLEGDDPANSTEDEEEAEQSEGIGLSNLEVTGYELNPEFQTTVYEYTINVDKDLTLADLEAIKETIVTAANAEGMTIDIQTQLTDDGTAKIIIVVKDDEREYSTYTITFVKQEAEEESEDNTVAVLGVNDSGNSNDGGTTGLWGLNEKQQIYLILGAFGISILFAIFFAISSYIKSRKLAQYEDYEEEDEETEFDKMNDYYAGVEGATEIPEANNTVDEQMTPEVETARMEELEKEPSNEELATDAAERLSKINGYRKMKKGRSGGRH